MDIPKLKSTYHLLLSYMQEQQMKNYTINATRRMCEHMIEHEGQFDSYPDYYDKYIDPSSPMHSGPQKKYYLTTLRRIQAFDEFDHYPDGKVFSCVATFGKSFFRLNANFKKFMEKAIIPFINSRQNAKQTMLTESSMMAKFLLEMQLLGATTLKKINADRIAKFCFKDGEPIRSSTYMDVIRMIFGWIDNPECQRIKSLIPKLKKGKKKFAPISEAVVIRIKEELSKENEDFSLRDRAIITIALYTGMRGTDISRLTIDNIDWDNDTITLIQSKTSQRLYLPLQSPVGNALLKYIKGERPDFKQVRYLFLSDTDKTRHMNGRDVGDIIEKFFTRTGILGNGDQRRIRMFRHHLASTLIENSVDLHVIRSILGHSTMNAINNYIDVDIEDLRKCGLDIRDFPMDDNLFDL